MEMTVEYFYQYGRGCTPIEWTMYGDNNTKDLLYCSGWYCVVGYGNDANFVPRRATNLP